MKYQQKSSVIVEAWKWDGTRKTLDKLGKCNTTYDYNKQHNKLINLVITAETGNKKQVYLGDFIVKFDDDDTFRVYSPEVFHKWYECECCIESKSNIAFSKALAGESLHDNLKKNFNHDNKVYNNITEEDIYLYARTIAYKVANNLDNGFTMDKDAPLPKCKIMDNGYKYNESLADVTAPAYIASLEQQLEESKELNDRLMKEAIDNPTIKRLRETVNDYKKGSKVLEDVITYISLQDIKFCKDIDTDEWIAGKMIKHLSGHLYFNPLGEGYTQLQAVKKCNGGRR